MSFEERLKEDRRRLVKDVSAFRKAVKKKDFYTALAILGDVVSSRDFALSTSRNSSFLNRMVKDVVRSGHAVSMKEYSDYFKRKAELLNETRFKLAKYLE